MPLTHFPVTVERPLCLQDPTIIEAELSRVDRWIRSCCGGGVLKEAIAKHPYPDSGPPPERWREVFVWRANVLDFISDLGDVMGEASHPHSEIEAGYQAMMPANFSSGARCTYCLDAMGQSWKQKSQHFDSCAVQQLRRGIVMPL